MTPSHAPEHLPLVVAIAGVALGLVWGWLLARWWQRRHARGWRREIRALARSDRARGAARLGMEAPVGTILPALFDPISRTLWTAIDRAFRPAGPDEGDLPYARTAGHEPFLRDGVMTGEDLRDQPPESHD